MPLENDQIIAEFVVESREHLADIEGQLLAIEAGGADIDEDLVNQVFRAVHSIKGAAGFLGLTVLGQLAHDMENVLNRIRNRDLAPSASITDVMLRAADALVEMLDDIEHSNEAQIETHIAALRDIAAGAHCEAAANNAELARASAASEAASPIPPCDDTVKSWDSDQPDRRAEDRRSADRGGSDRRETDANIRVSVNVLDSLMNLAGELVLSRNQLLQVVGSSGGSGLDSVAARLDQVTSELQESIMQTRMQAVGTVFNKFPRVVRDLSNQLGKQCQLTMEGEDVELDKSVIEAIGDPLTHLIRNAVDHGMESPDVRVKAGKPAAGKIILRAFHQAGKVNISVSDDGGGIDAAKVREKAVGRGIITLEQACEMSDREALRLLFRPGFSMAEKVTDVSGRGVGMDVVKTNIEKLGGAVNIDTKLGIGTTIDVKLPLTLAIIPSLIVRCRGNRFAIPQTSISELVRVKAGDARAKIQRIKRAEVFRLRGNLLPLVRLDAVLNLPEKNTPQENAALHIIVVEAGHLKYGLVVDGLHDSEEIVVKPLGRHMKDCRCMAGATVLGDGKVALILDVAGIALSAHLALPDADDFNDESDAVVERDDNVQLMLLFTNAPDEQFGIPMQVIARLERVRSDQIDSVGGQEVLQYRGGSLPLLTLEKYIQAAPRPETNIVYVLVYGVSGREVGLIAPKIIDIRPVSTDVDTRTLCEPGVIGSVVVDKKITRLLDLFQLTKIARGDWFTDRKPAFSGPGAERPEQAPTILLAEDSDFFRKQVAGFLQADGYEVVSCEDGMIAWNALHDSNRHFDLVVTDLEMPNMNGFQLSRKIKDDSALGRLPVIALTSLASEEDVQRGREAGIDDYQIKLDREQLLASVARYLQISAQNSGRRDPHAAAGMGR
jgi:two-component system, chemotaxis family, sensor kinase CheA